MTNHDIAAVFTVVADLLEFQGANPVRVRAYRNADNTKPSTGEKRPIENVFKFKDELPDAIRYAIMAWPELPEAADAGMSEQERDRERKRWDSFDERTRQDMLKMREYNKEQEKDADELPADDANYPLGDFFGDPNETQSWLS